MLSGYISREALQDILAVKDGEKDYLTARNKELQQELEALRKQLQSYLAKT